MANPPYLAQRAILALNVNPSYEEFRNGFFGQARFEPGYFEIPPHPIREDWRFEKLIRDSMYRDANSYKFDLAIVPVVRGSKFRVCLDGEDPEYVLKGCFATDVGRDNPAHWLKGYFRWDVVEHKVPPAPKEYTINGLVYRLVE